MGTANRVRADSPSDLILLLLHANQATGHRVWSGVTRLQKLAFLATRDPAYRMLVHRGEAPELEFEPYKMGPFTSELYDALETLTGFQPPLVTTQPGTPPDQDDLEAARYADEVDLDFVDSPQLGPRPTSFSLTPAGSKVAQRIWDDAPPELQEMLRRLVNLYGQMPLRQLLRRVYTEHKDMTTRSEIKGQIGLG